MSVRKLLVATRNAGKKSEIKSILEGVVGEIVFPDDVGILESEEEETVEDTGTYEGNAWKKAEYFAAKSGLPTVSDDSGIEVLWLKGAPGVDSRHFASATGASNQDIRNNEFLLQSLAGVPEESRDARYRCVVVYLERPGTTPRSFTGICEGRILEEETGDQGFGYDPLFYSKDLGKSFGSATREEKEAVSHRGRAFNAFRDWLVESGETA